MERYVGGKRVRTTDGKVGVIRVNASSSALDSSHMVHHSHPVGKSSSALADLSTGRRARLVHAAVEVVADAGVDRLVKSRNILDSA
jgi:hypothetical protein